MTDDIRFVDMHKRVPNVTFNYTQECPVCKGHGYINRRLNVYPLPDGYKDIPLNRNRYCHEVVGCSHCNGWGYVEPE